MGVSYTFTAVNGGADQSLVEWLSADTRGGELTLVATGSTYTFQSTDEGKWFTVRVTPKEEGVEASGTPASWEFYCEIKPDHKPKASNYYIEGEPTVGQRLILHYNYSDENLDREAGTTVVWERSTDGEAYTPIDGVDTTITDLLCLPAINYVLTEADVGCYIRCALTVNNATSTGETVYTDPVGVVYAKPNAQSVAIAVTEGVATATYSAAEGITAKVWWETALSENGYFVKISGASGSTLNTLGLDGRYLRCAVVLTDSQGHTGEAVYSASVKLAGTVVDVLQTEESGELDIGNGAVLMASAAVAPTTVSMTVRTSSVDTVKITSQQYDVFTTPVSGSVFCTLVLKDGLIAVGNVQLANIEAEDAVLTNVIAGVYADDGSSVTGHYEPVVELHGPLYGVAEEHIHVYSVAAGSGNGVATVADSAAWNGSAVHLTYGSVSSSYRPYLQPDNGEFFRVIYQKSGNQLLGIVNADDLVDDGQYHLYQVAEAFTGHSSWTSGTNHLTVASSALLTVPDAGTILTLNNNSLKKNTIDVYLSIRLDGGKNDAGAYRNYYVDKLVIVSHCTYGEYTSNNDATCFADGTKSATCTVCGKMDTVPEEGTQLSHSFTNYTSDNNATCMADGTKSALCDNGCGTRDSVTEAGTRKDHSFTSYVSDGNATCNADGTKTALCDYGCNTEDQVADTGSKLTHRFSRYIPDSDSIHKTASCDHGCGTTKTLYAEEYDIGEIDAEHVFSYPVSNTLFTGLADGVSLTEAGDAYKVTASTNEGLLSITTGDGIRFCYRGDGSTRDIAYLKVNSPITDEKYHLYKIVDDYTGQQQYSNIQYICIFNTSARSSAILADFQASGALYGHTLDMYLSVKFDSTDTSVYYIDEIIFVTECEIGGNYVSNNDATCQVDGTKTGVCAICAAEVTVTDIGTQLPHKFTNYVADANGTSKTASCDYGCGQTSTLALEDALANELAAISSQHQIVFATGDFTVNSGTVALDADAHDGKTALYDVASWYAQGMSDADLEKYWALDEELTIPIGIWTGRYDSAGVPVSTMIGNLTAGDIIADGSYHLYKFDDVVAVEEDSYKYLFMFETMDHQIKTTISRVYGLKGQKVDVYLSMKVTGDVTCKDKNNLPSYAVDRMIFVDSCAYSAENFTSDGNATCTADGTKTGTCAKCGSSVTVPEEGSMLGHSCEEYTSFTNGTCKENATKTGTCLTCGQEFTVEVENSKTDHSFTVYSSAEGTCLETLTVTASCDYGCGTTDTKTGPGSHCFTVFTPDQGGTTKTAVCDHCGAAEKTIGIDEFLLDGIDERHIIRYTVSDGFLTSSYTSADGTEIILDTNVLQADCFNPASADFARVFINNGANKLGDLQGDQLLTDGKYHLYRIAESCTNHGTVSSNKPLYIFSSAYISDNKQITKIFEADSGLKNESIDLYLSLKVLADEGENPVYCVDQIVVVTKCKPEGEYIPNNDATCIVDGTKSAACSVCGKLDTVTDEGTKLEHQYSDYVSDGNGYAVATCFNDCGTTDTIADAPAIINNSISLKGNIAVNYYTKLPTAVLEDENARVQFTMADGEVIQTPMGKDARWVDADGKPWYVFSCDVAAKEMTDIIKTQISYGSGRLVKGEDYSVKKYADYILNNDYAQDLKDLLTAMLNYGTHAQQYFEYRTDNLAGTGWSTEALSKVTAQTLEAFRTTDTGTDLAEFYGASLILKSETTLRFFFDVDENATFKVTLDGEELEIKERNGLYYVDVKNISAKDLGESITLVIDDGTKTAEVSASPMTYCYNILAAGNYDENMVNLAKALYLYYVEASSYLK